MRRVAILAALLGLALPAAHAQMGAQRPDVKSFTTFPRANAPSDDDLRDLPPRVDLSRFVPQAGHQGRTNTCTGWAVGYGLCSTIFTGLRNDSTLGELKTPPPDRVYSPSFIYALALGDGACNSSVRLADALRAAVDSGCCTWDVLPFDTARTRLDCRSMPAPARTRAAPWRLVGGTTLAPRNADALRQQLAAGNLIVFSAAVERHFRTDGRAAGGTIPFTWQPEDFDSTTSHAMLCMGYDDADQCFLMQNSWGPDWGYHGRYRMPYAVAKSYITEAYAVPQAMRMWTLTPAPAPSDTSLHTKRRLTTELNEGESVRDKELKLLAVDISADSDSLKLHVLDDDTGAQLHLMTMRQDQPHTIYHEGLAYRIEFTDAVEGDAARVRIITRRQERDPELRKALKNAARFAQ